MTDSVWHLWNALDVISLEEIAPPSELDGRVVQIWDGVLGRIKRPTVDL